MSLRDGDSINLQTDVICLGTPQTRHNEWRWVVGQDRTKGNMVYSTKYVVTVRSLRIDETRVKKNNLKSQDFSLGNESVRL